MIESIISILEGILIIVVIMACSSDYSRAKAWKKGCAFYTDRQMNVRETKTGKLSDCEKG